MKKVFCAMIVFLATAAWTQSGPGAGQGQTGGSSKGQTSGAAKKGAAITGCLSGPNDEGTYELTPKGSSKKVGVGGSDELSKHVGNEVRLHGSWVKSSAEIGEKESAEAKGEKGEQESAERHFKVTSIDHIADTCPAAGTGKSGGQKGSGKPSPSPHPGAQL